MCFLVHFTFSIKETTTQKQYETSKMADQICNIFELRSVAAQNHSKWLLNGRLDIPDQNEQK